jgi:hypothetical protein
MSDTYPHGGLRCARDLICKGEGGIGVGGLADVYR